MSFTSFCSAIEKERRRSRKLARLKRVHSRLASRQLLVFHNENSSASPTLMQSAPIAVNQHRISCDSTSRRALFSPSPPSPVTAGVSASTPTTPLLPISEPTVSAENIALSLLGHFSELRLPHESDMEWLVSEKDAPQHVTNSISVLARLIVGIAVTYLYNLATTDAPELARQSGRSLHAAERKRN